MKKIIALGASNSRSSINKTLAKWAAEQVEGASVEVMDLNDYEMPIYSVDRQRENGIPAEAQNFKSKIEKSSGIVLSLAEYNGSFSSAFKNIIDWVSRIDKKIWSDKPLFLLSTAPGPRGGIGVLSEAARLYPRQGAQITGSFALPTFHQTFTLDGGITNPQLEMEFNKHLSSFKDAVAKTQLESIDHAIN